MEFIAFEETDTLVLKQDLFEPYADTEPVELVVKDGHKDTPKGWDGWDLYEKPISSDLADEHKEVAEFLDASEALDQTMEDVPARLEYIGQVVKGLAWGAALAAPKGLGAIGMVANMEAQVTIAANQADALNHLGSALEAAETMGAPVQFLSATASAQDIAIAEIRLKLAQDMIDLLYTTMTQIMSSLAPVPGSGNAIAWAQTQIMDLANDLIGHRVDTMVKMTAARY